MEDQEPRHDVAELWPAYLGYVREQLISGVLALHADAAAHEPGAERVDADRAAEPRAAHGAAVVRLGFLAEPVDDPWGDWNTDEPWLGDDSDETRPAARWVVADDVTAEELAERLRAVGRRTTQVLATHPMDAVAAEGGRFDDDPATLEWICFHVLAEYARHAGHLDISTELGTR